MLEVKKRVLSAISLMAMAVMLTSCASISPTPHNDSIAFVSQQKYVDTIVIENGSFRAPKINAESTRDFVEAGFFKPVYQGKTYIYNGLYARYDCTKIKFTVTANFPVRLNAPYNSGSGWWYASTVSTFPIVSKNQYAGPYRYSWTAELSGTQTYTTAGKYLPCKSPGYSGYIHGDIWALPPVTSAMPRTNFDAIDGVGIFSGTLVDGLRGAPKVTADSVNALLEKEFPGSYKAFPSNGMVSKLAWKSIYSPKGTAAQMLRNPNTLIRFSTDQGSAEYGRWWTQLSNVTDYAGKILKDADKIKNALGLTNKPTWVALGANIKEGATVYAGEIAGVLEGGPPGAIGGATQLWAENKSVISAEAVITWETFVAIAPEIALLLLDEKHRGYVSHN